MACCAPSSSSSSAAMSAACAPKPGISIGCDCPPMPNEDKSERGSTALYHYRQVETTTPAIGNSFTGSKIEFSLNVPAQSYWRPKESFLEVQIDAEVYDTVAGVPSAARAITADDAGWAMNPVGNMFDAMEFLQGGIVVAQINSNMPLADALDFRIKKPSYIHDSERRDQVVAGSDVVGGQYLPGIYPYYAASSYNVNEIESMTTGLVWKPPVIRDIGKLPPGDYTLRLTPSQDWARRVLKLQNSVDLDDVSINGPAVSDGLNFTVAVKALRFWQSFVDDPRANFGSSYTVTVCTPTVQIQNITGTQLNERFTVDGLSNSLAVGFVDSRASRDPRIDYSSLNFWGAEDGSGHLPDLPEQDNLLSIAVETRGRSMPNPDLQVPAGAGNFRPLYMISKSSGHCFDSSEHLTHFLNRGLYLLQRIPQLGNNCSDQSVVRARFDPSTVIANGQIVLFQTTCRKIQFNVGAVCCPIY